MNSLKSKLVDDDPTLVLDFLSLPIQIQTYLELGVQYGRTLGRVATRVSKAVGVDITYEKLNTEYGGFVFDDKGNVIKIQFGDTTGLSAKINDPAARKSFAARHDCANKKDKTKAGYWSCNLPRYAAQLGLKGGGNFFW